MSDDLDTTIKTILQAKILAALKTAPEAIDAMVEAALSKPVDEMTGSVDRGYGRKVPYLEYVTGSTIRAAADAAVRDLIKEMQPQINTAIRKRLTADDLAASMIRKMMDITTDEWRINVNFGKSE